MNRRVKSRSGCRACKLKRLKCDESTPGCKNCSNRRIPCPGYGQILRWSTKHETAKAEDVHNINFPQFSHLVSAASNSVRHDAVPDSDARAPKSTDTVLRNLHHEWIVQFGSHNKSDPRDETVGRDRCPQGSASPASSAGFACSSGSPKSLKSPTPPKSLQSSLSPCQSKALQSPSKGLTIPQMSLVRLWFDSVCGMWAAMDSPTNPFRQVCSSLWSSNEAVFFSIQTMAAAALKTRPENVREIVTSAPQMSTQAMIHELQALFRDPHTVTTLPAGLLASLFCMSSSLNWVDSRQLGTQYLRNARSVIELLELQVQALSEEDKKLLVFFKGCLIYEEMLRSIITDDSDDIQALLHWDYAQEQATSLELHAWVGVPIKVIALFGKVMVLCRRSRKLWKRSTHATYNVLYQAVLYIQEGKMLEEQLLSIEALPGNAALQDTVEDENDPLLSHLVKAAEAFRLSALLQLYEAFPDLVAQRLPEEVAISGEVPTSRWLLPLALHIIDILNGIPATSSMRCLQPLLCLCAASALRIDEGGGISKKSNDTLSPLPKNELCEPATVLDAVTKPGVIVENTVIDVARNTIRERMTELEQNLPSRPIIVARHLMETIWSTYDEGMSPSRSHWIDIMTENKLECIFG